MYQQEIRFFWPLTEQIPLDLDYTPCQKPAVAISSGGTGITIVYPTVWNTTSTFHGDVDTKRLSIVLDKKPNFVVRWLYKLLNINWKI